MSNIMPRICSAAVGFSLILVAACSDQTGPTAKDSLPLDLGKRPTSNGPQTGIADPEYVEACLVLDPHNGARYNVEFQVDTLTQQGLQWEPRMITNLGDGECEDVWVNGGTFKDFVRISIIAPGHSKTYILDNVFRPNPSGGNPNNDIHSYFGPISGNLAIGYADGKHGTTATFTIH